MKTLLSLLLLALATNAGATAAFLGTDNQDVTITSFTVALPAGSNQLGTVSGSSVTSVLADDGGEHATITNGRLDVNVVASSSTDVSVSTVGIRGSQGIIITSSATALGTALLTFDSSRPSLTGRTFVYVSSNAMVVGGSLTLPGLANQVDLQAVTQDCTFNINGGDSIVVLKNTAESYNFDYAATNLVVNLTAKAGAAVCKARITGAN